MGCGSPCKMSTLHSNIRSKAKEGTMIAQDYKGSFHGQRLHLSLSHMSLFARSIKVVNVCQLGWSVNMWVATSSLMLANVERGGEEF